MKQSCNRPKVIILGAGFAGITAARSLAHTCAQVSLIDRNNYHLFQPLLYQVAMAGLSPAQIAIPIRSVLREVSNVEVLLGEVTDIKLAQRTVYVGSLQLQYDYLIVATGSTHSYFRHPEWEKDAPGLKTIEDALEIRRRVLLAFELAELDALDFASWYDTPDSLVLGDDTEVPDRAGTGVLTLEMLCELVRDAGRPVRPRVTGGGLAWLGPRR